MIGLHDVIFAKNKDFLKDKEKCISLKLLVGIKRKESPGTLKNAAICGPSSTVRVFWEVLGRT